MICIALEKHMGLPSAEKAKALSSAAWFWLRKLAERSWANTLEFASNSKKVGQDDPRRIIHSLKVGLALTLVSVFYYLRPLYDSFGVDATWAIITVIVVMEFPVGATLGKGLNRMLATILGGFLGFGVQQLATILGETGNIILIALFVYVIAAIMTFVRFFPAMKARYDYGFLIFILTFSMVSVSGYREHDVLDIACKRVSTIIAGCIISMIVCICIYPVWIGEDLHNLVAGNLEKLGTFLEGFGEDYFNASSDNGKPKNDRTFAENYESVLTSKTKEETMVDIVNNANLARWEPSHGQFRFHHPWRQYLKIGNLTRQCAYKIEALDFFLMSEIQTPYELRIKIKDSCQYTSLESGKALKELSCAINAMTDSSKTQIHLGNAKVAVESLNSLLRSNPWEEVELLKIIPAAAVASFLADIVTCIERISEAVHELASLAHFKTLNATKTIEIV